MQDGKWHHVVVTWLQNIEQLTLIIDGVFRTKHDNIIFSLDASESAIMFVGRTDDLETASAGHFSNVNMWQTILPDDYIVSMATRGGYDVGDMFAWKDFSVFGNGAMKSMQDYVHDGKSNVSR